jgi:phosphoribosylformylglycinamidine synthase I
MVAIEQQPKSIIIKARGTNCDDETKRALELAGASTDIVPLSQVLNGDVLLDDYQIPVFAGGFSSGDHLGSGEAFAASLVYDERVADQIREHVLYKKRPMLGICNGFQILVRSGVLQYSRLTTLDHITMALAPNESGHFEHRWIHLRIEADNASVFEFPEGVITLPVAHGEGRFIASDATIKEIEECGLVVFRYCDLQGNPTHNYPDNPNGSINEIAGICNKEGTVVALMPHPERNVQHDDHPNWRNMPNTGGLDGLTIFKRIVAYAKQVG